MEENKGMNSDGEPSTSKKVVQTALVTAAYFLFVSKIRFTAPENIYISFVYFLNK